MEQVKIISQKTNRIGIDCPELRFSRQWPTRGSSVMVEKSLLQELMFDEGFKYMVESGMLYVEDMEVKKELGLEPMDATEPVNIIVLSDKDMRNYWMTLSLVGFKDKVKKLSYEQIKNLVDFAVKNKIMDYDKSNFIKEICGIDIINTITLNNGKEG